jgi:tetratricopeptide (TPR) repeat protein
VPYKKKMNSELIKKAEELIEKGNFSEAIKILTHALSKNVALAKIYSIRAIAKRRSGDLAGSVADLDNAIEIEPNNPDFFSERGVSKHLMNKNSLAMLDFNIAIEIEPDYSYRYSSRAYIRAKMGDTEGAITDYEKAIELDPEDSIAHNNLGMLHEKMGYHKQSQKAFQTADELAKKEILPVMKLDEKKETLAENPKAVEDNGPSTVSFPRFILKIFSSKSLFKEFIRYIGRGFKL